jgi:hypothetical protein
MSSDLKTVLGDFFDDFAAEVGKVSGGVTVVLGGPMRLGVNMPQAIVNPLGSPIRKAYDEGYELTVNVEVVLVVQEAEPEDWFADIIDLLCDIVDEVVDDPTISGSCGDCWPTFLSPAEIKFSSKSYYGGVVRFQARVLYG